jgi:hypothetical protein
MARTSRFAYGFGWPRLLDCHDARGQAHGVPKERGEATQPGNPRALTNNQHIHSRASIARFRDERGLVTVLRRFDPKLIDVKPGNRWVERAFRFL